MSSASEVVNPSFDWSVEARFALYYAPSRDSGWWQAGCEWLGGDVESGVSCTPPQPASLIRKVSELTTAPRRYGWHGTLVAPFRLADGVTPRGVLDDARGWALQQESFSLPVEAATLGDFVALRPVAPEGEAAMRELASGALRTLGGLRATPSAADQARRLAAPLTPRQRALLIEWGYPYVFDEFRFHMTLSSSLDVADERAALVAWWHARIAELGPLVVDSAALFVERAPGEPFVLWQRLPFQAGRVGQS
jgi:putative phosphonate metabolism protein